MEVWSLRDVILAHQEGKIDRDEAIAKWLSVLDHEAGVAAQEFGFSMVAKILRVVDGRDSFI